MAYPLAKVKKRKRGEYDFRWTIIAERERIFISWFLYITIIGIMVMPFSFSNVCCVLILEIKEKIRSNAHVRKNVTRLALSLFLFLFVIELMKDF